MRKQRYPVLSLQVRNIGSCPRRRSALWAPCVSILRRIGLMKLGRFKSQRKTSACLLYVAERWALQASNVAFGSVANIVFIFFMFIVEIKNWLSCFFHRFLSLPGQPGLKGLVQVSCTWIKLEKHSRWIMVDGGYIWKKSKHFDLGVTSKKITVLLGNFPKMSEFVMKDLTQWLDLLRLQLRHFFCKVDRTRGRLRV